MSIVKMMIKYPFDLELMAEKNWDEEDVSFLVAFSFATFINIVSFLLLVAAWIFIFVRLFV